MKVKIIRDKTNGELESLFLDGDVLEGKEYEVFGYGLSDDIIIYGEYAEYNIFKGEYEVVE